MTSKAPDNAYIQIILEQWGRYCRQVAPTNLGYPTRSACCPPSPGGYNDSGTGLDAEGEESARHVDRILAELKRHDRATYRALEQVYLWRVSAVEASARLGVSRARFYTLLGKGEAYITGAVASFDGSSGTAADMRRRFLYELDTAADQMMGRWPAKKSA